MMRRVFLITAIVLTFAAAAHSQSGRAKGSTMKVPVPIPPPPTIAASPDPAKSAEPPLPEVVDGERIYKSRETDEHFQILKKPLPTFTREARRHSTRGTVKLSLILAADETVKHIEVLRGLPDGLTEKAIEVARQIKFKPAMEGGKPVSVWVEVEYGFQLY
jgi:TonB family protein